MSDTNSNAMREKILKMMGGYQASCVIGAAAELDLWTVIGDNSVSADELASQLKCDLRGLTMLLDAVCALQLLDKNDGRYSAPQPIRECLDSARDDSLLPIIRHHMCILRQWSQLAWTVKSGMPTPRMSSMLGPQADRESFIQGMHSLAVMMADDVVASFSPEPFSHLLDVGGASGSYTIAFLKKYPDAKATLFDLPDAVNQARPRIEQAGMSDRVQLVAGDYYRDELPGGADLAWVSAIVHQHGREENRQLFEKVRRALVPGGQIALRDVVMQPDRTSPPMGALFAINMLVNTATGGTFTFEQLSEDLQAAGFVGSKLVVEAPDMNSIVTARVPE